MQQELVNVEDDKKRNKVRRARRWNTISKT